MGGGGPPGGDKKVRILTRQSCRLAATTMMTTAADGTYIGQTKVRSAYSASCRQEEATWPRSVPTTPSCIPYDTMQITNVEV